MKNLRTAVEPESSLLSSKHEKMRFFFSYIDSLKKKLKSDLLEFGTYLAGYLSLINLISFVMSLTAC